MIYVKTGAKNSFGGWEKKSVLLASEMLGRRLRDNEVVRYKDRNPLNCVSENIVVIDGTLGSMFRMCQSCGGTYARLSSDVRRTIRLRRKNLKDQKPHRELCAMCSRDPLLLFHRGIFRKATVKMTTTWRNWISKATDLAAKSTGMLYERVALLNMAWEDEDFKTTMINEGKKPLDVLNDLVSDACANFTELRAMIKAFPNKRDWNGDISRLKYEALKQALPQSTGNLTGKPRVVSSKAFETLKEENSRLRKENARLRKRLARYEAVTV